MQAQPQRVLTGEGRDRVELLEGELAVLRLGAPPFRLDAGHDDRAIPRDGGGIVGAAVEIIAFDHGAEDQAACRGPLLERRLGGRGFRACGAGVPAGQREASGSTQKTPPSQNPYLPLIALRPGLARAEAGVSDTRQT
jgi:hypothetical protein